VILLSLFFREWRALVSVPNEVRPRPDTVRGTNEPEVSESVGEGVVLLLCGGLGWTGAFLDLLPPWTDRKPRRARDDERRRWRLSNHAPV